MPIWTVSSAATPIPGPRFRCEELGIAKLRSTFSATIDSSATPTTYPVPRTPCQAPEDRMSLGQQLNCPAQPESRWQSSSHPFKSAHLNCSLPRLKPERNIHDSPCSLLPTPPAPALRASHSDPHQPTGVDSKNGNTVGPDPKRQRQRKSLTQPKSKIDIQNKQPPKEAARLEQNQKGDDAENHDPAPNRTDALVSRWDSRNVEKVHTNATGERQKEQQLLGAMTRPRIEPMPSYIVVEMDAWRSYNPTPNRTGALVQLLVWEMEMCGGFLGRNYSSISQINSFRTSRSFTPLVCKYLDVPAAVSATDHAVRNRRRRLSIPIRLSCH
ncbi:hypothetical protein DFH06DRAFT_1369197 [Mycena polygramma]|nr:hypothetical protein DFH06DRAFT_1369197 [Mycena polygramma]